MHTHSHAKMVCCGPCARHGVNVHMQSATHWQRASARPCQHLFDNQDGIIDVKHTPSLCAQRFLAAKRQPSGCPQVRGRRVCGARLPPWLCRRGGRRGPPSGHKFTAALRIPLADELAERRPAHEDRPACQAQRSMARCLSCWPPSLARRARTRTRDARPTTASPVVLRSRVRDGCGRLVRAAVGRGQTRELHQLRGRR